MSNENSLNRFVDEKTKDDDYRRLLADRVLRGVIQGVYKTCYERRTNVNFESNRRFQYALWEWFC